MSKCGSDVETKYQQRLIYLNAKKYAFSLYEAQSAIPNSNWLV